MDDALELTLLFDYYGELLTPRQRTCFDMKYNQDLTLGEIAQELQVSRQGVYDNLSRAESLLRHMEEKTLCVRRDLACRRAMQDLSACVQKLLSHHDEEVSRLAQQMQSVLADLEE